LLKKCLNSGDILVNGKSTQSTVMVTKDDKVLIIFGGDKPCYAGKNRGEYFAEGVQCWYNTNRTMDHDHNHIRTREQLKAYDPALAKLCADVLGENEWRFVSPRKRAGQSHLKDYDPAKAPVVKELEHIKTAGLDYYDTYWSTYWDRLHDKYPYLVDDGGEWNVRKDVRNTFFCMAKLQHNDWLTAENGNGGGNFGPEIGIGNYLGEVIDAPVLLLKSCVGNRALGWDLLPPSAVGTGSGGQSYQGDSESLNRKVKEKRDGWYAGLQYDQDVGAAQDALKNLSTYYPGAKEYEVAGFFWWQGNAEKGKGNVETYDKNLAFLFNDLKKDFNAPNAKFVCATLGEHDKSATLSKKMFDFAGLPEFKDEAAVFYSKPVSKGGGSGGHYGGNPETYMNVGEGMGKAMVDLLSK
ncbi:hypothetical protein N9204_02000, partial [bacterium]|nr:hypothetical protein [bacterium]